MQYGQVRRWMEGERPKGYEIDPAEYLRRLPDLAPRLPEGARRYAVDGDHFDFLGTRCVKDLRLEGLREVSPRSLVLSFAPNRWKHDAGLRIRYRGVTAHSFEPLWESGGYGTLLLDELLPTPSGFSHELAMTGGTFRVEAADLEATWLDLEDGLHQVVHEGPR